MSKIVLANGCFDLLHYGHLRHLQAAAEWGDLFVGVTRDKFVKKGAKRPRFPERERMAMLLALRCVKYAYLVDSSLDALKWFEPDIWALGREYYGKVRPEDRAYCRANGIEIRFTHGPVFSSTALLNGLRPR